MTTTTTSSVAETAVPLACVADAIPVGERAAHFERMTTLLTTAARERRDLPDGYAFRFDAGAFGELARWITHERRCCPFLRFTLELEPDAGPVWLRLTGPAGTRAFLRAELPTLPTPLLP